MAKIISIINFKGGVGKTTIALNIGAGLAQYHSQRVLLIDTDPQTNLTFSLMPFNNWKKQVEENGSIKNLFEAFMDRNLSYSVKSSIMSKSINGLEKIYIIDLLPSHLSMLLIDVHLAKSFVIMGEFEDKYLEMWEHRAILKNGLKEVHDDYDIIIIDCPPNFNIVTQNAIFASDCYIIPAIPDYLSVLGMKVIDGLVKEIDDIGKNISPKLNRDYKITDILGIVFNRVKLGSKGPVQLHSSKMKQIEEKYPNKLFQNYITDSIAIPESTGECIPIFEYDNPKAKNSKEQFKELTNEIYSRINSQLTDESIF
jgi:chromosome partitioning protein